MIPEPMTQLKLLLAPFGIKTVTSGSGEAAQFLKARYGANIQERFESILDQIEKARVIIVGVPNDNGAGFDMPYIAYMDAIGRTVKSKEIVKYDIKWINEPLAFYSYQKLLRKKKMKSVQKGQRK